MGDAETTSQRQQSPDTGTKGNITLLDIANWLQLTPDSLIESGFKHPSFHALEERGRFDRPWTHSFGDDAAGTVPKDDAESQTSMIAHRGSNLDKATGTQYADELLCDITPYNEENMVLLPRAGSQFGSPLEAAQGPKKPTKWGSVLPWRLERDEPNVLQPGDSWRHCRNGSEPPENAPSLTADRSSKDTQSSTGSESSQSDSNPNHPVHSVELSDDTKEHDRGQPILHSEAVISTNLYCDPTGFGSWSDQEGGSTSAEPDDQMDIDDESPAVQSVGTPYGTDDTDSGDAESFWMSDYSERTLDLEEQQPSLYRYRWSISSFLIQQYSEGVRKRTHSSAGTTSGPCKTGSGDPVEGGQDASGNGSKKRKRDDKEDDSPNDDSRCSPGTAPKSRVIQRRRLLLACPFCKKDPQRHRACYRKILTKISYVKQHLSRFHRLPIYCSVCYATFDSEDIRDDHARSRSCDEQPKIAWEGVSEVQKKELQKRVSPKMSEEDQWYMIFEVLFPGEPRPRSAYVDTDLAEDLRAFRDFAMNHGPRIIGERLRWEGYSFDQESNYQGLGAFHDTVIADGIQAIFERWQESEIRTAVSDSMIPLDGDAEDGVQSHSGGSSSKTLVQCPAADTSPVPFAEEIWSNAPTISQQSQWPLTTTHRDNEITIKPVGTWSAPHHAATEDFTALETQPEMGEYFEMASYLNNDVPADQAFAQ